MKGIFTMYTSTPLWRETGGNRPNTFHGARRQGTTQPQSPPHQGTGGNRPNTFPGAGARIPGTTHPGLASGSGQPQPRTGTGTQPQTRTGTRTETGTQNLAQPPHQTGDRGPARSSASVPYQSLQPKLLGAIIPVTTHTVLAGARVIPSAPVPDRSPYQSLPPRFLAATDGVPVSVPTLARNQVTAPGQPLKLRTRLANIKPECRTGPRLGQGQLTTQTQFTSLSPSRREFAVQLQATIKPECRTGPRLGQGQLTTQTQFTSLSPSRREFAVQLQATPRTGTQNLAQPPHKNITRGIYRVPTARLANTQSKGGTVQRLSQTPVLAPFRPQPRTTPPGQPPDRGPAQFTAPAQFSTLREFPQPDQTSAIYRDPARLANTQYEVPTCTTTVPNLNQSFPSTTEAPYLNRSAVLDQSVASTTVLNLNQSFASTTTVSNLNQTQLFQPPNLDRSAVLNQRFPSTTIVSSLNQSVASIDTVQDTTLEEKSKIFNDYVNKCLKIKQTKPDDLDQNIEIARNLSALAKNLCQNDDFLRVNFLKQVIDTELLLDNKNIECFDFKSILCTTAFLDITKYADAAIKRLNFAKDLVDRYLSKIEKFSTDNVVAQFNDVAKQFSDDAKNTHPDDASKYDRLLKKGYVSFLNKLIDIGLLNRDNIPSFLNITSQNDYHAFLALAKYAFKENMISNEDKVKVDNVIVDSYIYSLEGLDPQDAAQQLAWFIADAKELYANDDSGCVGLLVGLLRELYTNFINTDNIHLFLNITSQNDYHAFLALAKYAFKETMLSDEDKVEVDNVIVDSYIYSLGSLDPQDAEKHLARFIADAKELYANDDSGYDGLLRKFHKKYKPEPELEYFLNAKGLDNLKALFESVEIKYLSKDKLNQEKTLKYLYSLCRTREDIVDLLGMLNKNFIDLIRPYAQRICSKHYYLTELLDSSSHLTAEGLAKIEELKSTLKDQQSTNVLETLGRQFGHYDNENDLDTFYRMIEPDLIQDIRKNLAFLNVILNDDEEKISIFYFLLKDVILNDEEEKTSKLCLLWTGDESPDHHLKSSDHHLKLIKVAKRFIKGLINFESERVCFHTYLEFIDTISLDKLGEAISADARNLYPNDCLMYAQFLEKVINKGFLNKENISFTRDIQPIEDNDVFLDLAKYAFAILSDNDKREVDKELVTRYLLKSEDPKEVARQFCDAARKLYQEDDSGYVDLFKTAIAMGLINSDNISFTRDIQPIEDNDVFLDLAKHACQKRILSDADDDEFNAELMRRMERPQNTTMAPAG